MVHGGQFKEYKCNRPVEGRLQYCDLPHQTVTASSPSSEEILDIFKQSK